MPASCNPAWDPSWHSCGPNHDQDCCASKLVPGGIFYRDYDSVDHISKAYSATVSPFRLGVYEITVGRFRAFILPTRSIRAFIDPRPMLPCLLISSISFLTCAWLTGRKLPAMQGLRPAGQSTLPGWGDLIVVSGEV